MVEPLEQLPPGKQPLVERIHDLRIREASTSASTRCLCRWLSVRIVSSASHSLPDTTYGLTSDAKKSASSSSAIKSSSSSSSNRFFTSFGSLFGGSSGAGLVAGSAFTPGVSSSSAFTCTGEEAGGASSIISTSPFSDAAECGGMSVFVRGGCGGEVAGRVGQGRRVKSRPVTTARKGLWRWRAQAPTVRNASILPLLLNTITTATTPQWRHQYQTTASRS